MADVIRVIEQFGDGSDQLLLNSSGTLVGVFYYDRDKDNKCMLAVYTTADGRPVGEPLPLGDCRGLGFLSDDTLVIANERKLIRWKCSTGRCRSIQ